MEDCEQEDRIYSIDERHTSIAIDELSPRKTASRSGTVIHDVA
jgi:hypothetical protein